MLILIYKNMLTIIFYLVVLLFSVIIHEIAHAGVAYYLGDQTAKYSGRLTLNPIKHIDIFGSIILPLSLFLIHSPFLIGWAKPVPINPYNFRDQKWGNLKVSIAGPLVNFLLGIIFCLPIRFLPASSQLSYLFGIIAIYNFMLGIFNLIPIPPLDGSWIFFSFLPERLRSFKILLQQYGTYILIFLLFFSGLNWVFSLANIFYAAISGR
jgi:Zn-dependent protease